MNQARRDEIQEEINHLLFQVQMEAAVHRLMDCTSASSGEMILNHPHGRQQFRFTWDFSEVKPNQTVSKN